ncbi:MAG: alginate export family protein, partial [Candidatus Omnitrophota bacterium]
MSKKLILVMVFALVFAFSCAAYAEVQNVKIGGDITAVGISRESLDFEKGFDSETSANNEFASIARIKIDADLTDGVSVTFRLLNERVWGGSTTGTSASNVSESEVDVDLAYITLKEFMKPTINVPVNLIIGRQNIKIGSGLMIGAAGTNQGNTTQLPVGASDLSARGAFDAIVSVWDFTPELSVIAGFAKVTEGVTTEGKDTDAYILDATYKLGENAMNTVLEGTFVGSRTVRGNVSNYGGRVTSTPITDLNVEGEYVYQVSNALSKTDNAADAVRANATYTLSEVAWKPALGVDYMKLSKYWNALHESIVPADLTNLLFDNSNLSVIGASVSAKPMDDLTLKLRYANLSKASKNAPAALNDSFIAAGNADKKALGYEVDAGLVYDYT